MRLEILVDSEEPVIYPLNKPEIVIGAGEACDIILGSAGISRKHVKVIVEKDSYFVIDQGSTNGTFINEERLVPGRKTEFTSFFPVRLGSRVLLTLLSDEEAHDSVLKTFNAPQTKNESDSSSTRVISLKDLQASSTKNLVKNRQASVAKKKITTKTQARQKKVTDDSTRMYKTVGGVLLLLGVAFYFKFYQPEEVKVAPPRVILVQPKVPVPVAPGATPPEPERAGTQAFLIQPEELISLEKLSNIFGDLKCLIPEEIYFCEKIPSLKKGNGGVASLGSSLIFLIDQAPWLASAEAAKVEFIKNMTGEIRAVPANEMEEALWKLAFLDFLKTQIELTDLKDYQEKIFYIVFYPESDQKLVISKVFAIRVSAIPEVQKLFSLDRIKQFHRYGPSALKEFDTYFKMY